MKLVLYDYMVEESQTSPFSGFENKIAGA